MKKAKVVAVNLAKGDYQLRGWKDLDTSSLRNYVTMEIQENTPQLKPDQD